MQADRWKPYTIVPEHEVRLLQALLIAAPPGPVAVAGSYRGGDVMALWEADPSRSFVVLDSFRGTADPTAGDEGTRHPRGDFDAGGPDAYLRNFDDAHCPRPGRLVAGYIDAESLRSAPGGPYAMAWLDLDHHRPTLDSIGHFWPLLAPGGLLLTHDHGNPHCPGIARAAGDSGLRWTRLPGSTIALARKD